MRRNVLIVPTLDKDAPMRPNHSVRVRPESSEPAGVGSQRTYERSPEDISDVAPECATLDLERPDAEISVPRAGLSGRRINLVGGVPSSSERHPCFRGLTHEATQCQLWRGRSGDQQRDLPRAREIDELHLLVTDDPVGIDGTRSTLS